jgi:hypothetical protein
VRLAVIHPTKEIRIDVPQSDRVEYADDTAHTVSCRERWPLAQWRRAVLRRM